MDEAMTSIPEEATALKRPAEADSELDSVPPSKIAKTPSSFKNVFRQLSVMRPGLLFDLESEVCDDGVNTMYTMAVDVDGVKFTGTGPSKRNAKVLAAEKVLAHLEAMGVKPIPESERPPKPVNANTPKAQTPSQASTLTEEQKAQQMLGKNPVMMLHEIRPSFDCEIVSDERVGTNRKVEMSITVDGQKFTGAGRSNKIARARAAVAALEKLFSLEFTDFGENEIPVYLGEEWKWRKFTKKAEKTAPSVTPLGRPMKNAMMQLNDMYKGLEFRVKDRSGPDHCPFFKVCVEIEGQNFEGQGSTKKAAKLDAAEKALVGLSLTGALAQRATQKKQQKWGAQRNWNTSGQSVQGKNVPQLSQSFQPASSTQNGSGTKSWQPRSGRGRGGPGWNSPSWMADGSDPSQNGQSMGGSGRGSHRGRGRGGQNRGRGRGMGRGNSFSPAMQGMQGMDKMSRPPSHLSGHLPVGRGRGILKNALSNQPSGASNKMSSGLLGGMTSGPPSSSPATAPGRGRSQVPGSQLSRGGNTLGSQNTIANQGWDQQRSWSSDYSAYQDPYDTNSHWNSQGYGYDAGYDGSYDSTYDTSYDASYDTSYDTSYTGGYEGEGSEWNSEYYGY